MKKNNEEFNILNKEVQAAIDRMKEGQLSRINKGSCLMTEMRTNRIYLISGLNLNLQAISLIYHVIKLSNKIIQKIHKLFEYHHHILFSVMIVAQHNQNLVA